MPHGASRFSAIASADLRVPARIVSAILLVFALGAAVLVPRVKVHYVDMPVLADEQFNLGPGRTVQLLMPTGETTRERFETDNSHIYWFWVSSPAAVGVFLLLRTFLPGFGAIRALITCAGAAALAVVTVGPLGVVRVHGILNLGTVACAFIAFSLLILLLGFMPKGGLSGGFALWKRQSARPPK